VRPRTVASSLYNMAVQTQIYRTPDKLYYYKANKALQVLVVWNIMLFIYAKAYYQSRN
jgi:hypothetical protein